MVVAVAAAPVSIAALSRAQAFAPAHVERLWDAEEDDAFVSAQVDNEDDDAFLEPNDPIEAIWARAFEVAAEIAAIGLTIRRVQSLASFDPNDAPLEELRARSDVLADQPVELEFQMRMHGFSPRGWSPSPGAAPPPPQPPSLSAPSNRLVEPAQVLRPRLTDNEYQHWEWLDQGVIQVDIGRRLGISQAAVSKRERKLRSRIDAVMTEATGHPYHWVPIPKPQGGRRRRS
jgi:DNA-binding CsgD family transcriptional regulator